MKGRRVRFLLLLCIFMALADVSEASEATSSTPDSMDKGAIKRRSVEYQALMGVGAVIIGVCAMLALKRRNPNCLNVHIGPLTINSQGMSCKAVTIRGVQLMTAHSCSWPGGGGYSQVAPQQAEDTLEAPILPAELTNDVNTQELQPKDIADEPEKGEMEGDLLKRHMELQEKRQHQRRWLMRMKRILLVCLYLLYICTSVGVPAVEHAKVSCTRGFFWEHHVPFMMVLFVTKMIELSMLAFDPTIVGKLDLLLFALKFFPSVLGFLDGYTDATSATISEACTEFPFALVLGKLMILAYAFGVLLAQWVVFGIASCFDNSQVVLLKLLHMDAVASCYAITESTKNVLFYLSMVRTVLEDVPQAVLQTLFILYVHPNYFLFLSVAVGVASSCKALYEAHNRSKLASGVGLQADLAFSVQNITAQRLGPRAQFELQIKEGMVKAAAMKDVTMDLGAIDLDIPVDLDLSQLNQVNLRTQITLPLGVEAAKWSLVATQELCRCIEEAVRQIPELASDEIQVTLDGEGEVADATDGAQAPTQSEFAGQVWEQEAEVTDFPIKIGTLESLDIVNSSFTLMATVFRDTSAPDSGGQYVSDQAIFAQNEFDNSGDLTNLHVLVRDGKYSCNFYRSGYAAGIGESHAAAKDRWQHVAFVLDKDTSKAILYLDGEEVDSADCPPLDDNPGNRHDLWLGQYAYGRHWRGRMKEVRVLKVAWRP